MDFDPFEGGADPARISEAAHLSAHALVQAGKTTTTRRSADDWSG